MKYSSREKTDYTLGPILRYFFYANKQKTQFCREQVLSWLSRRDLTTRVNEFSWLSLFFSFFMRIST